jgi:hypothetical protein
MSSSFDFFRAGVKFLLSSVPMELVASPDTNKRALDEEDQSRKRTTPTRTPAALFTMVTENDGINHVVIPLSAFDPEEQISIHNLSLKNADGDSWCSKELRGLGVRLGFVDEYEFLTRDDQPSTPKLITPDLLEFKIDRADAIIDDIVIIADNAEGYDNEDDDQ